MQTTHNLSPAVGAPGMLFDEDDYRNDIVSAIAGEDLQPGRFVELSSSDDKTSVMTVQLCQGSAYAVSTVGVVIRDMQREANNWPDNTSQGIVAGSRVAILRRGRIFVERDSSDSNTVSRFQSPNIMHSTNASSKRGMVTLASTSTSSGAEVSAQSIAQVWQDDATTGLMCLEVFVK